MLAGQPPCRHRPVRLGRADRGRFVEQELRAVPSGTRAGDSRPPGHPEDVGHGGHGGGRDDDERGTHQDEMPRRLLRISRKDAVKLSQYRSAGTKTSNTASDGCRPLHGADLHDKVEARDAAHPSTRNPDFAPAVAVAHRVNPAVREPTGDRSETHRSVVGSWHAPPAVVQPGGCAVGVFDRFRRAEGCAAGTDRRGSAWARADGFELGGRGRLPLEATDALRRAHELLIND